MSDRVYIAIDLKSFYASVECRERGLDPLTTNLVVADASRTTKTICLAVSPSLKAYGIPGRARLFEVVRRVQEVNDERKRRAPGHAFTGKSCFDPELKKDPCLEMDYITATPRMAAYLKCSAGIYDIYLRYVAPEDIHVYSIDEVFMDVTAYLEVYKLTPRELAVKMIREVYAETGITATAGIGTNLYLCKIAMDIGAKQIEDGVRIAQLDEMSYRRQLWTHRPLTDFWRVGRGYARKLEENGLMTMGDIARCSLGKPGEFYNEDLLYRLFGINAELLIDHAWGWEPCTIAEIKRYKPDTNSIGSGQVLHCPYDCEKARLVVREMAEQLALDLLDKKLVTDQMVLTVGYDVENLTDPERAESYQGEIAVDHYGRSVPKHAHGTANLDEPTSSARLITQAVLGIYDRVTDERLLVRRVYVTANHVTDERTAAEEPRYEQLELFADYDGSESRKEREEEALKKERQMQEAMLAIQKRYGKNAILKGSDLQEGATTRDRNAQIGGHKA